MQCILCHLSSEIVVLTITPSYTVYWRAKGQSDCVFVCATMRIQVNTKAFFRACMHVCLATICVCNDRWAGGDAVNCWWIVSVTGLEATATVQQLSDAKSVRARLV